MPVLAFASGTMMTMTVTEITMAPRSPKSNNKKRPFGTFLPVNLSNNTPSCSPASQEAVGGGIIATTTLALTIFTSNFNTGTEGNATAPRAVNSNHEMPQTNNQKKHNHYNNKETFQSHPNVFNSSNHNTYHPYHPITWSRRSSYKLLSRTTFSCR